MNHLLIYLLESSICLGVFYLFYIMVLHDQPSHQYNRFYLLATSLLSLVLPLLEIPILVSESVGKVAGNYQNFILLNPALLTETQAETSMLEKLLNWQNALLLLYGFGVLLTLTLFIKQSSQLIITVRKNQSMPRKKYRLIYTEGKLPTSSCFSFLFWDNTQKLTQKEAAQIIAHEEAHIQQKHSYDVFYMAVLKIFFWFHPLVYLYERALIDVHEFAADATAIEHQNPGSYAKLLTRKLFDGLQLSLVNHFYKSRTLKRIKMMHLKNQQTPRYKLLLVIPLFLAVFFTFSCQTEEELEQEAIATTYEDVQAQLQQIEGQINTLTLEYFDDYSSVRNEKAKLFKERGETINPKTFELELWEETASLSTYRKVETLFSRRDALREKLATLPDPDGIYTVVENQPEPEGGIKEFYQHIGQNLKYPAQARRMGIEGKVFVQFVVNEYGELSEFQTLKGIGAGCDNAAIEALQSAPAWNPGTTQGKPVKVRMVMPITFKLDHGDNSSTRKVEEASKELSKLENSENNLEEIVAVGYTK
ncbi:TonB family protein [Catalinimonas alkaloidigena]|uniref:TonB family protein n=1 Tax=Catalinimonas alkaloidigena TaxID=1075417 RepID=UPI002406FE09|nr:TonB family protein [Catalinimonas alkaloidigena]MDF9799826.1 TonB family protein [Catalinimonas alkaloidigena]